LVEESKTSCSAGSSRHVAADDGVTPCPGWRHVLSTGAVLGHGQRLGPYRRRRWRNALRRDAGVHGRRSPYALGPGGSPPNSARIGYLGTGLPVVLWSGSAPRYENQLQVPSWAGVPLHEQPLLHGGALVLRDGLAEGSARWAGRSRTPRSSPIQLCMGCVLAGLAHRGELAVALAVVSPPRRVTLAVYLVAYSTQRRYPGGPVRPRPHRPRSYRRRR